MKKAVISVPLYLNRILLMPIIGATTVFGGEILKTFGKRNVCVENVKFSAKAVMKT